MLSIDDGSAILNRLFAAINKHRKAGCVLRQVKIGPGFFANKIELFNQTPGELLSTSLYPCVEVLIGRDMEEYGIHLIFMALPNGEKRC